MKIYAETDRLILREIISTDIDGLFALDSDPAVHKYLGNEPVIYKEKLVEVIDFIRKQYEENGIGRWTIVDKKTNAFIGWAGLKFVTEETNNHINYYDLGYRIIQKYWNQGFATEAALASLKYAFTKLDAKEVYAITDSKNRASNHILYKIGFSCTEKFMYDGAKHHWYKIKKSDFEKR
jgi:RimJ/RimL family protein N-acetyltransferase